MSHSGCEESQPSLNVSYPSDDPKRPPLDVLSKIWIRQRGGDWRPRRASVATCQQQQQFIAQRCTHKSAYQFNMKQHFTTASIKELTFEAHLHHNQQKLLQQQQTKQHHTQSNSATADFCMPMKEVDNVQGNQVVKNQDSGSELIVSTDKSTNLETGVSPRNDRRHHISDTITVATGGKVATTTTPETAGKLDPNSNAVVDDSLHKPCYDSSVVSINDKEGRAVNKLNASSLNSPSGNRIPVSLATCCSDFKLETSALHAQMDCVSEDALKVALNEKLQMQDKQRKHVIRLMGLKQNMMANHSYDWDVKDKSLVDQDCCKSSSRSRSCSFGTTRTAAATECSTSALTPSISMVSDRERPQAIGTCEKTVTSITKAHSPVLPREIPTSSAQVLPNNGANKTQEERNISKPQLVAQQTKSSLNQEYLDKVGTMRQLVTSITSSEREDDNQIWHDQMRPSDQQQQASQNHDLETRPASTLDQWHRNSPTRRARNEPERRSCSALGRNNPTRSDITYGPDEFDTNLEEFIVESWLDDHPAFTRDYFIRKATRQIVDDWLVANARVSNTNLSSQADLRSNSLLSRPVSQISLGGYLREPSWEGSGHIQADADEHDPNSASFDSLRPARSNSQSGSLTSKATKPTRKISATDFETRTGGGFLRPMLSKTPDGRLSFLLQSRPNAHEPRVDCFHETKVSKTPDGHRSKDSRTIESAQQLNKSSVTIEIDSLNRGSTSTRKGVDISENENIDREIDDEPSNDDGEVKLIFELVENIYCDLDIRTLLHKILRNIAVLINADRSSLFLVCGRSDDPNRRLVSQLFNVDQDSIDDGEPEESIIIPWGTGLVGYVAESGETVNITDCYGDPRFTDAIDQRTGYRTRNMICAPILDKCNEIVGVAQVINKRDGCSFTKSDELKFKRYLQFCGIGLRNAQSYEQCQLENKRNQVLLDLARMVFEEQSTIEQVVHLIMSHTQSLLDCERCQVLLTDDGNDELENLHRISLRRCQNNEAPLHKQDDNSQGRANESSHNIIDSIPQAAPKLFSLVFDLECDQNDTMIHDSKKDSSLSGSKKSRAFPINIGITGYVLTTGHTLNIKNAHEHERFDKSVDEGSDFVHKSILCMPIQNGQRKIIGVIQLINKKNGQPFNKNDEDLFEAFAIFCGLGIQNTLMYERVLKIMAKQKVTFDVLSYHATAPLEEAKKLSEEQVPSCFTLNLASLQFDDFALDDQHMLKSCLRFFLDLDLMRRFQIDRLVLCNWILSVRKNYRKVTYHPIVGGNGLKESPVRYHNWRHAFNVSQMMFAILLNTQICRTLGELETLALLIACLCHDLDHRGTNNSFQIKSASPLAELYSTSTMEHHHFDQCVMILNSQGNQILANLSPEEYSKVIMLLEEAIIATDLENYFRNRDQFFQLVNSNNFDWKNNSEHRSLLRCMLMTACDVAAITKPWSIQKTVADLVMSEFYQQGDFERNELKIEPIDMMNRDKMNKLPAMQIGFIETICAPIYTAFAKLFPNELTTLLDGCLKNRDLWKELAKDT